MKKIARILTPLFAVLAMVGLDQWTKYLTIQYIPMGEEVKILGDAVVFTYVQNRGMAWGLFQNGQLIFSILTPIAMLAILFFYIRTPWEPEYRPIRIAEIMLVGGALGNLLDRIFRYDPEGGRLFHGYVVDMIYVKAIKFPVFNVADSFVTIAFFLMLILLIFVYNEEEFNKCFGNFPQKKKEQKPELNQKEEPEQKPESEPEEEPEQEEKPEPEKEPEQNQEIDSKQEQENENH